MPSSDQRRLLYYANRAPLDPANRHLPGVARFNEVFKIFGPNCCFVDRTDTLRSPMRTSIWSPMPAYRKMTRSYEELCNERAVQLLDHAEKTNLPLYLLYSGGIDSTLVLVSLIKNAKPKQLDRVVLLLTRESISENPRFFRDHIVGKFAIQVAPTYPLLLSKKRILVCGELNDQVMGSDVTQMLATKLGNDRIHARYNRDDFFKLFALSIEDPTTVHWYLDRFEMLKAAAPIPIETNVDHLWWLNFALKWQSVVFRIVSYMPDYNLPSFDKDFIDHHFFGYFGTDDFQLWAMNNLDKKIKDTWESYKFAAKDVIFEFDKDDDYRRRKTKQASLNWVLLHQVQKKFITDDYRMHLTLPPEHWYEPDNSFRVGT